MKILWLCNVEIPQISRILGKQAPVFGGWLAQTAERLCTEHRLHVLYPDSEQRSGGSGNLTYQSFSGQDDQAVMAESLEQFQPQVIHVWGTEVKHTDDFMQVAERMGMLDRCAVSIQGLVSAYDRHYTEGLPEQVVRRYTLRDRIKGESIADRRRAFARRGEYEVDALRRAKHIIGRTEWDRACTSQINPEATYHFCNETLRPAFYQARWELELAQRHSIFVSQCSYPIKGMHLLLEAMPLILARFPDAVVYTTGPDLLHASPKARLLRTSYQRYLLELIAQFGLQEHVRFLGMLSETEMRERYLASHVFVSPSTIENSPNSVGEAMLLGTPVVSSYVGGTMSMMTHGQEGFLYQSTAPYMLADYVNQIFSDDELAKTFSRNARARAAVTHDPELNHARLLEIYETLREG